MLYHVTAVKGNTATVNVRARNHSIVIDEPVEQGGTDMGMNPVELLLSRCGFLPDADHQHLRGSDGH